MKPMATQAQSRLNRTKDGCAKTLRRANAELRLLLLENEAHDELVGCVAEGVNRITRELDDLAGRQELFEMWSVL
jgi:hypothetical protein